MKAPRTDARLIGALDIGGTKMAASVASAEGPLARVTEPTVKSGSPRALAEKAIAMIDAACGQAGVDVQRVDAVGVSSCGPFVRTAGMIGLAAPNICGARQKQADLPNDWDVIPLESILRERFADVDIENDCVSALVAERTFGAVQDEADCVYVTWSTGIGFGFCVDGHVLRGKQGNAGHAGHMLMSEQSDALCGCGNRGDLEAMVSGRNIGNSAGRPPRQLFDDARAALRIATPAVSAFMRVPISCSTIGASTLR